MPDNKKTGDYGERLAVEYLAGKGYALVCTNYRNRTGEIDIIAKDGGCVVFAEVKLRNNLSKGYPREAVGYSKQSKIKKTALHYLARHNLTDTDVRFDVVEIICGDGVTVEHIENAF